MGPKWGRLRIMQESKHSIGYSANHRNYGTQAQCLNPSLDGPLTEGATSIPSRNPVACLNACSSFFTPAPTPKAS